ncbi:MAG: glycosyltransferase family 9 protein, partial [Arthrobacter sp.]
MGRVLVARLDSMGDVLLSGPAVRAVANGRAQHGGSTNHVVMLCGRQGEAAAAMLPGVDDVYSWDSPWIMNPAPRMTGPHADRLIEYVRNSRITEAVILTSFHQSPLPLALLLRLAGVERITGASTDYAGSLLDVRLKPGEDFP